MSGLPTLDAALRSIDGHREQGGYDFDERKKAVAAHLNHAQTVTSTPEIDFTPKVQPEIERIENLSLEEHNTINVTKKSYTKDDFDVFFNTLNIQEIRIQNPVDLFMEIMFNHFDDAFKDISGQVDSFADLEASMKNFVETKLTDGTEYNETTIYQVKAVSVENKGQTLADFIPSFIQILEDESSGETTEESSEGPIGAYSEDSDYYDCNGEE